MFVGLPHLAKQDNCHLDAIHMPINQRSGASQVRHAPVLRRLDTKSFLVGETLKRWADWRCVVLRGDSGERGERVLVL
jgi:hypothetical protein